MSTFISGKSKFKALRNIGFKIPKYAIGTFQRYTDSDGSLPGHLVILFAADPNQPWYVKEKSMSPLDFDDEPAIKYIGDIE